MLVELALSVLLLVLLVKWKRGRSYNLPPGPVCLPIIGANVGKNPMEVKKSYDKYGDIIRFRAGQVEMVLLFNYKTVREVLSRADVSDRPQWEALQFLADGGYGILFSNGENWRERRRFLLRHLRDMGMGKSYLHDAILLEAKHLVEDFANYLDQPTCIPRSLKVAILNVIWQLVASKRYSLHDETLLNFMELMKVYQKDITIMVIPDIFKWIRWIIPRPIYRRLFLFDKQAKNAIIGKAMMKEIVDDHRSKLDPDDPRDVIDIYLLEIEARKGDPSSVFTEDALIRDIFELFAAGFDTTSMVIQWVCTFVAAYPEVQKKIQREIDEVVGRDELPSHLHRPRLPYLEATLHEVHRLASPVTSGVPRVTSHDIVVQGYDIPKDTVISGYTSLIHTDPQYWKDPLKFDPDRFLDEYGNFVSPKEGFLPFGIGKRSCLGEALARMELYVFTAALLQNFTFAPPEGCEVDLTPQYDLGGSSRSKEQDLVITARK